MPTSERGACSHTHNKLNRIAHKERHTTGMRSASFCVHACASANCEPLVPPVWARCGGEKPAKTKPTIENYVRAQPVNYSGSRCMYRTHICDAFSVLGCNLTHCMRSHCTASYCFSSFGLETFFARLFLLPCRSLCSGHALRFTAMRQAEASRGRAEDCCWKFPANCAHIETC